MVCFVFCFSSSAIPASGLLPIENSRRSSVRVAIHKRSRNLAGRRHGRAKGKCGHRPPRSALRACRLRLWLHAREELSGRHPEVERAASGLHTLLAQVPEQLYRVIRQMCPSSHFRRAGSAFSNTRNDPEEGLVGRVDLLSDGVRRGEGEAELGVARIRDVGRASSPPLPSMPSPGRQAPPPRAGIYQGERQLASSFRLRCCMGRAHSVSLIRRACCSR